MDTAKVADVVFTHGGDAARAGGLLPDAARGRRHGPAARHRAAGLHPHHRRHRQRGVDGGRDQGPRARRSRSRSPTSRSSRGSRSSTRSPRARCRRAVAAATGMDAMTHAIEGYVSTDWSPHQDARSLQALRMIRDNLERGGRARRGGRGGARQHADRREPRDHDRARLGARDVAPGRRALRRAARRGERDPPAARDPTQRAGGRGHRRPLPRRRRDLRRRATPTIGRALADYVTELIARLGLPTRLSRGRRARGRDPGARGGRDGRRHDAAQPARDDRGGLRGAVPQALRLLAACGTSP